MRTIPLTQGFVALVDDEDFEVLAVHRWYAQITSDGLRVRAVRWKPGGMIYMHREILGTAADGLDVDHREHRPLADKVVDNRRSNLRAVPRPLNNANGRKASGMTSVFKGVHFEKRYNKWAARIKSAGKAIHVGYFQNEGHAALAYDIQAVKLWGEHALTNFPIPGSSRALYGGAN